MTTSKNVDLVSLLEKAIAGASDEKLEEIGTVVRAGDGIALVYGLAAALYYEVVKFEGGNLGVVLSLDEHFASVVFFDRSIPVVEQEAVKRTGQIFRVPVGEGLLGRVISATGEPLDGLGDVKLDGYAPMERPAPSILDRAPIDSSLETGITVIDCLVPIGKGQRELLIGNRTTGKTAILLDTIVHQMGKDVICVFVSIGHKRSTTAKIVDFLSRKGALEYTIIVEADAHESALSQFFAPYVGCTIAEYFTEKGKDVLIVYDDLSAHAIAYRELSLLLRRSPGREAYPGDIFYIHSRLLERACKLSDERGGGSLTAIPVIQTQGGDFSAYIPTNLISITDGQIFLDADLFNEGIRPAVNVGLSVSRVGGKAQTKAIKKVAGSLKLDLAQYEELASFSKFGSELDKASQDVLERGRVAKELLKQNRGDGYTFVDQTIMVFLLKERVLDDLGLDVIKKFAVECVSYVATCHAKLYERIRSSEDFTDSDAEELRDIAEEFCLAFSKS